MIVLISCFGLETPVGHDERTGSYQRFIINIPMQDVKIVERRIVHGGHQRYFNRFSLVILDGYTHGFFSARQGLVALSVQHYVQIQVIERNINIFNASHFGVVSDNRHLKIESSAVFFLDLV